MTLEEAQSHLTESLAALKEGRKAQSVSHRDYSVSRVSITELLSQVAYWQRVVNEFNARSAGVRSPSIKVATWNY